MPRNSDPWRTPDVLMDEMRQPPNTDLNINQPDTAAPSPEEPLETEPRQPRYVDVNVPLCDDGGLLDYLSELMDEDRFVQNLIRRYHNRR